MSELIHPLHRFRRPSVTQTTFCPGCGDGIVVQCILRAIDGLKMDLDDFVFVSGIGCAAWIPSPFFNADVLHTTHGRPIAFAFGIKMGLPDKKVMVISGDGDLMAIGGNHLGHASVFIEYDTLKVYVDPYSKFHDFTDNPKADLILVTH